MKIWATIVMMAAALGLTAQEAAADRERAEASRPHREPQAQARHHHRPVARPATGFVLVPTLWPWSYTYPPSWYHGYSPFYAVAVPLSGSNFATDASGYAYFCPDSKRYYPEVRECPAGWLAVVPGVAGPPN